MVNEGEYGAYFVFMCENRRMKPVEIILRRGRREDQEQWRG
jgi:hypothetical protein